MDLDRVPMAKVTTQVVHSLSDWTASPNDGRVGGHCGSPPPYQLSTHFTAHGRWLIKRVSQWLSIDFKNHAKDASWIL
jgi:hypothetical protein